MAPRLALAVATCLAACLGAGAAGAAVEHVSGVPLQAQEWWLHDIGADQATPPGPGVPLTLVDTGVDASHPDLLARPDTTYLDPQTTAGGPDEWHGTADASVAAGDGDGIAGVYPAAALQSWDGSPVAGITTASAVAGIVAAAQRCPGVISLEFGGSQPSQLLEDAVLYAFHRGCLVVAPAGNGGAAGGSRTVYPASLPHVLTVAATDQADRVASFSTASPANDLAAPGVGIVGAVPLTVDPTGFHPVDGTNVAASIVAAAAAWVWTARPTLTVTQLFDVLRTSARDVGAPGFDFDTGFGVLDIPAALAAPPPALDPFEPNDDVNQIVPGELFEDGEPALTTDSQPSIRIAGSLDASEDPRDVYRIRVPAGQTVRVTTSADGNAAARIWGPHTVSVREGVESRRRDLYGAQLRAGAHGVDAYVEVLLTGRAVRTSYVLRVRASTQ